MTTSAASRMARSIGVVALALAAVGQFVVIMQPLASLNVHVLHVDDAFYYLQIARNIVRHGWASFDGLHPASGVQLLWTGVLTPIAWFIDDRMMLIRAALSACIALNAVAGLLLRRWASRAHSPLLGELIAVLWAVFVVVDYSPSLTGMEYSLHTAVAAATLALAWPVVSAPGRATAREVRWLALALTLNFWTRLDSALYSLIIGLVAWLAIWRASGRQVSPRFAFTWLAGIPALGAVAYGTLCYRMAGSLVPLSGVVKGIVATRYFAGQPWATVARERVEWWAQIQGRAMLDVLVAPLGAPGMTRPVEMAAVGLVGAASVWYVWLWAGRPRRDRQIAGLLLFLVMVGGIHAVLVIASVGHFAYVTPHYYTWQHVAWTAWLALLAATALERCSDVWRRVILVGAALVVLGAQLDGWQRRLRPEEGLGLRNGRQEAIAWAATHLPPEAIVGSWNAGQIGYFLDRPVVNLDGLVNDRRFLAVVRGERSVEAYLAAEGIQYLIDFNEPDLSMPYHATWNRHERFRDVIPMARLEVLHRQAAGGVTLEILRVRPSPAQRSAS